MQSSKKWAQLGMHIRAIEAKDVPAIYEIFSQEACFPNTTHLPYPTKAFWQDRFENAAANEYYFLIENLAEKERQVLGFVMIITSSLANRKHTALFGITVRAEAQGQGIGSCLMEAIIDFCENTLAVNRIELGVNVDNTAAIALYKKFGFNVEATLKKHTFRQGHYVDGYQMARLSSRSSISASTINTDVNHTEPTPLFVSSSHVEHVVRHVEPTDIEQILALYQRASFGNSIQHPDSLDGVIDANAIKQRVMSHKHNLIVEHQGRIIAYAGLQVGARPRIQHEARLEMVIQESDQQQGVGSQLLRAIIDLAFNWLQLQRLSLMVCTENHAEVALYQQHQFVIEGTAIGFATRQGHYINAHYIALTKECVD